MQLKTILNCVHRQPGFVYGQVQWFTEGEHLALRVQVRPHGHSRGRCSKCLKKRPGYDTLSPRQFAFVPPRRAPRWGSQSGDYDNWRESRFVRAMILEYGSYFSEWRRRTALKMWSGWPTFPMVFVKGTLIGGAAETEALVASGELQRMLAG